MHKASYLLLAVLTALMAACKPESVQSLANDVNLLDPKPGQQTYFLRYTNECGNYESKFALTGDTLIWEIYESAGELFARERLTPGSPAFPAHEVTYPMKSIDDNLILKEPRSSQLFFFFGNDTLRLQKSTSASLTQEGCRINVADALFLGNEVAKLARFEVGPYTLEDKLAASCIPLIMDVDAYLIYEPKRLYASQAVYMSGWVNGWINPR
jgi:hypothetical protein